MPLWAQIAGIALGSVLLLIIVILVFFTDYSK